MKQSITLLFLILLLVEMVFPTKVANTPELSNPFLMEIQGNRLYVTQGHQIFIYSLDNYNLVTKFGEMGEGPGAFKINPSANEGSVWAYVEPDYILVNSVGRISYFSLEGKFLKEQKCPYGEYQPMGDKFVSYGYIKDQNINFLTVNIYDNNFKKIKELYRQRQMFQEGKKINPFDSIGPLNYVYDKKIFVKGETGVIHVFDDNGEKLYDIKHDFPKLAVTDAFKKEMLRFYRTSPTTKQYYDIIKERLAFPSYFPKIRWFNISDNNIYILTYKKEKGKSEFFQFDLKGKYLNRYMLPLSEKGGMVFDAYTIHNGKLFQLTENFDTETWELHVTEIK